MQNEHRDAILMRPTIIIGGGGTGYDIVVRVKARFHETYPRDMLKQIKFVVFDTDTDHAPVRNSTGDYVRLTPDLELFQIGGVPVSGIIANRANYPAIAEELELDRLPRLDLTKGAKQVRQLGRLAFFYHFERIRKVISGALNEILNIANYNARGAAAIQAINVFFIGSACGGTGSGIMIDLAYLTRYLAQANGIPADHISSTSLLIMPEAFAKVPRSSQSQIRANASAMLREIDHFSAYGDFKAHYPGMRIEDGKPPFNIAYIVDATNERSLTVEDANQLTPIMAEAVFLQAGTYLGAGVDSAFDNVATAMGNDISGYTRSYSMIGAATLRFNALRMRKACALQLQRDLVHELLLRPLPVHDPQMDPEKNAIHPDVRPEVVSYMGSAHLSPELMKASLQELPGNRSMVVDFSTNVYDDASSQVIVSQVERAGMRYAQRTVSSEFIAQAEQNRIRLADATEALLAEQTYRYIDEPESGLHKARHFLEGVILALEPVRQTLQGKRAALMRQASREQRDLDTALQGFHEAAQSFFLIRVLFGRLRRARIHYTNVFNRNQKNILDQAVVNQSLTLLNAVENKARILIGVLGTMQAALLRTGNEASQNFNVLCDDWSASNVTEQNIDTPTMVERFYRKYRIGDLHNEASELVADRAMSAWYREFEMPRLDPYLQEKPVEDKFQQWIETHCYERYSALLDGEGIESLIKDRHASESDQRDRLRQVISLAAPFSNYDETASGKGSDDFDEILVIGVPDRDSSIFRDMPITNATLISTYDRHRISVLYSKHGLPLYGLRQFPEYNKHYARLEQRSQRMSGTTPFICFPVVRAKEQVRQLFVMAEVFGLVVKRGVGSYVLVNTDGTNDEIELGENLYLALRTVMRDERIQRQMTSAIKAWRRDHDEQSAIGAFGAYLQWEKGVRPTHLHDDLRQLAQSEYDRLQAMLNA